MQESACQESGQLVSNPSYINNNNRALDKMKLPYIIGASLTTGGKGGFFFWAHFQFPNQWGQRSNPTRSHTPRRSSLAAAEI